MTCNRFHLRLLVIVVSLFFVGESQSAQSDIIPSPNNLCQVKSNIQTELPIKVAVQTDPKIDCEQGLKYLNGIGVDANVCKAYELFKKASENGHPAAQYWLGMMLLSGIGSAKDVSQSMRWLQKAAEQGHVDAQYQLALLHYGGANIRDLYMPPDYSESAKWFRQAAEKGHADSQNFLGLQYLDGKGFSTNNNEALKWFLKAAEQGQASAQCNLGYMYEFGLGISNNPAEALHWYRKSADKNCGDAQGRLGYLYLTGAGVQKDSQEAFKWISSSASNGSFLGQYFLGYSYEIGGWGKTNWQEAVYWYMHSAKNGNREAIARLLDMGLVFQDQAYVFPALGQTYNSCCSNFNISATNIIIENVRISCHSTANYYLRIYFVDGTAQYVSYQKTNNMSFYPQEQQKLREGNNCGKTWKYDDDLKKWVWQGYPIAFCEAINDTTFALYTRDGLAASSIHLNPKLEQSCK